MPAATANGNQPPWAILVRLAQKKARSTARKNPNSASVRFLIDGAPIPADAGSYQRLVLLFDGGDPEAVAAARERWTAAKAEGFDVTYWQTDERGRWQRKG